MLLCNDVLYGNCDEDGAATMICCVRDSPHPKNPIETRLMMSSHSMMNCVETVIGSNGAAMNRIVRNSSLCLQL